ncbi:NosR/NirI family protein [Bradyrhizobium canariense]|uniref:NosR/NirI family transcriptional regulator, nitrous oxide reductase regulator n=1 Tax=Bradyrhizobium canariense TaxID=255045 RepID=A0A1H2BH56_9BRAD|nr:NosR/NirI family protein [Bradyrhizobium canariense]SDT57116.1 NosR/NirI family transcriptional regulator, nitrous oxide reductase regulator [Bradyrhizobium canariense]
MNHAARHTAVKCLRLARIVLVCFLILLADSAARAQTGSLLGQFLQPATLVDVFPGADRVGQQEGDPPAAPAYKGDQRLGYVYLTSDVVNSTGYSGKPIRILIGIDLSGRIVGAKLVEHHEPIVLVGIPAEKLVAFIQSYVGHNASDGLKRPVGNSSIDIISGATVTTMVIGDSITRSAIRIAESRGLGVARVGSAPVVVADKQIDPNKLTVEDWQSLLGDGSIRRLSLSVDEINDAFAKSDNKLAADHPDPGPGSVAFIDLYVAQVSVPSIGRSVLGDVGYQALKQRLQPDQQTILIAGTGRYSFKGSGYVRGGIFDRIELVQGDNIIRFHDHDHERIGDLSAAGAPPFPEIGLFTVPAEQHFDPTAPWRLVLLVQREIGARDKAFLTFDLSYQVPSPYLNDRPVPVTKAASPPASLAKAMPQPSPISTQAPASDVAPLWQFAWRAKAGEIVIMLAALMALTAIFFFQTALVRRPLLYHRLRFCFLAFTLLWIGWYAEAQLSIVNVLAFFNALRTDFRWDYFLMDPLIFILWCAVAAGILFWGRGAFCGWLCPFGALQELLNAIAKLVKVPQISVPFGLHQRLWPIKYIVFLALFAFSLYDLSFAEEAAEVEPFKTAIVLRFMREWPFILYVLVLLSAGLFIERFFCRYLCPLGAALAIPGRMRMFDWLRRYRECGSSCHRCAVECPVQAIHPEGNINPNECIQCLHCQELYHDDHRCPVMIQLRLKSERRAAVMTGLSSAPSMMGDQSKQ